MYHKIVIAAWVLSLIVIYVVAMNPHLAPPVEYQVDKIVHFLVFAFISFIPAILVNKKLWIILLIIALSLFGVFIEVGQSYISGRIGSRGDVFADVIGIISGVIVARYAKKYFGSAQ